MRKEQPHEGTEEKGPRTNYIHNDTDSITTEKVKAEELNNLYQNRWEEWVKWYNRGPEFLRGDESSNLNWAMDNEKENVKGRKEKQPLESTHGDNL